MQKGMIKKTKKQKNTNDKLRDFIFDLLVCVCLAMMAFIISPKDFQNDTFYTIKCGEYIFQNGIFNLKSDPFSWLDLPYNFPHWLYDLGIFLIYNKLGFDGIYFSTILLTALLGFSIYATSLYCSKNKFTSAVLTFLTLYLMEPYIAARAQLPSYLLFSLEILCIEKIWNERKKIYGFFMVLIALILSQSHVAVYPMFFIFALPYITEFVLVSLIDFDLDERITKLVFKLIALFTKDSQREEKYKKKISKVDQNIQIRKVRRDKNRAKPYKVTVEKNNAVAILIVSLIFCVLVGLLNPTGDGFTAYTYLAKTFEGNTTASINEHLPVTLADSSNFAIALVIFLVILTFMDTKIKLRDLFMLCGVTYMAFESRRQIALFAIVGCIILAKLIAQFFEKYDKKTTRKLINLSTTIVGIVLIVGSFAYYVDKKYDETKNLPYVSDSDYPIEASKWINSNLDLSTLKLYNEYNYGSYLLYQGIPVFIDSRADLYAPEFNDVEGYENANQDIFTDALDIPSLARGYEDIFEKYGVNHVILYANAKLCLLLNEDDNYEMLYDDNNFRVYERLNADTNE